MAEQVSYTHHVGGSIPPWLTVGSLAPRSFNEVGIPAGPTLYSLHSFMSSDTRYLIFEYPVSNIEYRFNA